MEYKKQFELWPKRSEKFYKKAFSAEFSEFLEDKQLSILEIGFGPGNLLSYLKESGFTNITGVEIDQGYFDQVKSELRGLRLINGDAIEYLEKTKDKFDLIFMIDVIEHVEADKVSQFLSAIYRCLNKNGRVVIRTVNAESVLNGSFMRYIDCTHKNAFTRFSIRPLLEEAGFVDVEVRSQKLQGGLLFIVLKPLRWLVEWYYRLLLVLYHGESAFKSIQTANLIASAKREN